MRVLADTRSIILMALLLSIIFPGVATFMQDHLIIVLIFMLSISIRQLGSEHLNLRRKEYVVSLVFINLILLSGAYILLSNLIISNELYRDALIIYGLMPPAIGIVSIGYIYHADMKVDMYAEFIGYILSLAVIPLGSYLFLREAIAPVDILEVIFLLIVVPFVLSRIIRHTKVSEEKMKVIISMCFGIVIFTIVGSNLELILENINDLIEVSILLFIMRILVPITIFFIVRKHMEHEETILFTMFGSMKNGAAATAIALMLLGVESTVPLAVEVLFFVVTLAMLDFLFRYDKRSEESSEKTG